MRIEEAQRILQEAGWETIPPKITGVVTDPKSGEAYWFCYPGELSHEFYSEDTGSDRAMLRHHRIFHDEASAKKRLQDDDHYIEVDRREVSEQMIAIAHDLRLLNKEIPRENINATYGIVSILETIKKLDRILTPPLPQAEGPK